jgi:DNA-binding response OmpR family regulator
MRYSGERKKTRTKLSRQEILPLMLQNMFRKRPFCVLAKKEFELLHLLAANRAGYFLRNEILEQVWGNEVIVGDRTIDVHIRKIRQKLGVNCISTIKGVGYKFDYEPTTL